MGSEDSRKAMYDLLRQYGFSKELKACFESPSFGDDMLKRLKRDIDALCDYYDIVRIYQYPMDDTLVISSLKEKKWKKTIVRKPA
jgi:CRISPR-associated protein Cas2